MLAGLVRAVAVALPGLACAAALAQNGLESPAAERARPRLIAETASIAPGQTILIGVTFDIEPEWHTYWHGLNDTVPGPWVEFKAPEGFAVGDVQFPAPRRYIAYGRLVDHIYEGRVTLVAPLTAPEQIELDAVGGAVEIKADVNWTVCSDVCLMADATLELSLPVAAAGAEARLGTEARRFAEARSRLPRPLAPEDKLEVMRTSERVEIRAPGASRLAFYPHEKGPALADLLRDGEARGEKLTLRLADRARATGAEAQPLAGVLEVWREGERETTLIELRITADGRAEPFARQPLPAAPGAAEPGG